MCAMRFLALLISCCWALHVTCMPLEGEARNHTRPDARAWVPYCKRRGVAHQFQSTKIFKATKYKFDWWYDWGWQLKPNVVQFSTSKGKEFIPMQWSKWSIDLLAPDKLPAGTKHLLGYNEPNHNKQARLSPQEAAALWPKVQAVADQLGLLLGAPAAAPCGADCLNPDPFSWWDQFFALCQGCRFDFLATHYYSCSPTALASYLQTCRKYGLPIWLTEFACPNKDSKGPAAPYNFMPQALTVLDSDPWVETYAWFTVFISSSSFLAHNGLMDANTLKPTPLGKLYIKHRSPTCAAPARSTIQFPGPGDAATRKSTGDWGAQCSHCIEAVKGVGIASLAAEEQQFCRDCGFLDADAAEMRARAIKHGIR